MLYIKLNNELADLPADINVSLTGQNPFLSEDGISAVYSFPIDLPPSEHNLRLLGYPHRITSEQVTDEVPCEIGFAGQMIAKGKFTYEVGATINGYFNGLESRDNFDTMLSGLKLDFDDEGHGFDSEYCTAANLNNDKDVVFAPIKINGDIDTDDVLAEWRNYLNYYTGNGRFIRDMMPGVRVGYLFDKIVGPNLAVNPFRSGAYRNVVLQTIRKKDWAYPNPVTYSNLEDYLPEMRAGDFLTEVLKLFCASMTIENNRYEIHFRNELFDSADFEDISGKIVNTPTLVRDPGREYVYGYSGDARDPGYEVLPYIGAPSSSSATAIWLYTPYNLLEYEYDSRIGDEQQFQLLSTGQFVLRVANEPAESKWKYEIVNSGFGYKDSSNSESYDTTVKLRPMDMTLNYILKYQDGSEKAPIFCPQVDLSDLNSGDAFIMLWQGMLPIDEEHDYPYLSAYNFSGLTPEHYVKISPFSLCWETDLYGAEYTLIWIFHRSYRAWIEKRKMTFQTDVLWNPVELSKISWLRKYYINGRRFFLREYTINLTLDSVLPTEAEFVSV